MTVPLKTKWHHVNDCQIRQMLTDPEGDDATYDDWIDVPGIKTLGVGGTVETQTLTGDNVILDQDTQLTGITVTINHAKLSLEVLAVMLGGTVTESGTTPAGISKFSLLGTDEPSYWELRAMTTGTDIGIADGHLIFPKCKVNGFPDIGFAERDYRTFSGGGVCIPRTSDGAWFDIELNETAVDIAAIA